MYGECTMHFIKASTLDSLVDEAIRKVAAYVLKDEQAFLQQVKELYKCQSSSCADRQQKWSL